MDTYKVKLTFTEPLLGTVALDKKMYEEYILSKHPELEEKYNDELETIETLDEAMEKGTTGFHRHGGQPILYDYAIKGYFKEACYFMRRVPRSLSSKVTAYKKVIDGLVFVEPRRIPIQLSGDVDILTRPLRAQTAQGERVALSRSEMIPPGSTMEFQVKVLGEVSQELLEEWLAYGSLHGLGQWRSASYGRFNFELTKL